MKTISVAIRLFVFLTIVTGIAYPLIITAIGQTVFRDRASGSPIIRDGVVVGSQLIGQEFTDPKYFWGRGSATGGHPYNSVTSGGSNLGPINQALIGPDGSIAQRVSTLRSAGGSPTDPTPTDLATTSASGLDPHISWKAADYQVRRVARARNMSVEAVQAVVNRHKVDRQLGILGEPVVNVLELNLELDRQ
ncbi:MAG: potassium-transporting ATPase subunit KdpC [Armatimonadetes bacterium]|nr:potassium-transporting ATPase subunit KdpC [Armatimonadota bacterium]